MTCYTVVNQVYGSGNRQIADVRQENGRIIEYS